MSAFLCGEDTFSTIYSGMRVFGRSNSIQDHAIKKATDNIIKECLALSLESDKLADAVCEMYRLNVRAVNQRYGERAKEAPPKASRLFALNPHVSKAQFLKSLNCLHYQMSEGNVPETRLYALVDALSQAVEHSIAVSSPEYELAKWG